VLIITTAQGVHRLHEQGLPRSVNLVEAKGPDHFAPAGLSRW